jgi:ERCC4-type nuclease
MIIKIDVREKELFAKCQSIIQTIPKFANITLFSETLLLGDIIINDGVNDCIIIERKTLSDLMASIKDGRYKEQCYRLNGLQHHNHNIIFLIEGDISRFNCFKDTVNKQTLYSVMFSINYFKGFSLMCSYNLDESAFIICNMAIKLISNSKVGKMGFYSNTIPEKNVINITDNDENKTKELSEKDYCSVIKKVKKENITTENIGEIMLCQIPGISSTSALAILAEFKTLTNLIKCIQENENCLNNICTTDTNGKSRKISKTVIATIIKFLKV